MSNRSLASLAAALLGLSIIQAAWAQSPPTWGAGSSPSPTANSGVSKDANTAADKGKIGRAHV